MQGEDSINYWYGHLVFILLLAEALTFVALILTNLNEKVHQKTWIWTLAMPLTSFASLKISLNRPQLC